MFQNRAEALALALPAAVFAAIIFLVPVVIVLAEGFRAPTGWTFSAYTTFFSEPLNRLVLLRTFKLGLAVTLELPLIIIDVQRGGPSTGLPTKTEQSDLLQAIGGELCSGHG